jgi:putative ABC transport system ATP-binding protein
MQQVSAERAISAHNLTKTVSLNTNTLTILDAIDLEVSVGESVAILGASGSGKSTLLGLLAGLDPPSSGRVLLNGQDLVQLNEDQRALLRARSVGFVFQSFQLLSSLTALENVMLPLEVLNRSGPRRQAEKMLERVLRHYPKQLSGGEQQRVALARAFVTHPEILFADEPTGNLDATTGARIADLLFELNHQHRTTLVLVTHDMKLARRCHRMVQMDAGRIGSQQNPDDDFL